jgi:hypothetical protein
MPIERSDAGRAGHVQSDVRLDNPIMNAACDTATFFFSSARCHAVNQANVFEHRCDLVRQMQQEFRIFQTKRSALNGSNKQVTPNPLVVTQRHADETLAVQPFHDGQSIINLQGRYRSGMDWIPTDIGG